MPARSVVRFGAVLVAFAGCRTKAELVVKDTEGRSFAVQCGETDTACELEQRSGPRAARGSPILRSRGRFVAVCDGPEPVHTGDCRPLTCTQDTECPPASGSSGGTCIGSLCVEPSHSMGTDDAVMLCMAGTGLGHERADQVARYALGLNCGTPCTIPTPCRRP
jgi:hypothetical protein